MPEFAEVHTQVGWLKARIKGWPVSAFGYKGIGHFSDLKGDPQKDKKLHAFFDGATVLDATQRGKHVLLRLSTGTLTSHLMFTGRWSIAGDDFISNYKHHKDPPEAASANFWIESNGRRLNFHEPEHKGRVIVHPGKSPGAIDDLKELGPDILVTPMTDGDFTAPWTMEAFTKAAGKTKTPIKALLLDQKKQAGIGNMYACESLYRAGISPTRPSNAVTPSELLAIFEAVQAVVGESIKTHLDYDRLLKVYKREKDPEGVVVRCDEVGGRDTYWVPSRQT